MYIENLLRIQRTETDVEKKLSLIEYELLEKIL